MASKKIAILYHELDPLAGASIYVITELAKLWAERGFEIEFLKGISRETDADVLIPHIDLTKRPPDYQDFIDRHEVVLNRTITDTSKSSFSTIRVFPGDPWAGPVVVKTDENYGGLSDQRILDPGSMKPTLSQALRRIFFRRFLWRPVPINLAVVKTIHPRYYPVFESVDAVPSAAFDNPALIVERFIPEKDGTLNCSRSSIFLGNRAIDEIKKSPEPMVKAEWTDLVETADSPDALRDLRKSIAFDFGKIDYVIHDGAVTVFDMNPTPSVGQLSPEERRACALTLADAIDDWL